MTKRISLTDAVKQAVAEWEPTEEQQAFLLLRNGDSLMVALCITIAPADRDVDPFTADALALLREAWIGNAIDPDTMTRLS